MTVSKKLGANSGLSIIEVLIGIGLLSVFVIMSLIFSQSVNRSSHLNRAASTRDRLLLRVRNVAGMPSTLRNSIKASLPTGLPANPELNNCLAGTQANACKNDQESSVTLYSPTLTLDAAGNPLGLLPITSPQGTLTPNRFDSFGVPCAPGTPDCIFIVYTSFRPKCPPYPLPATPPAPSDPAYVDLLKPMDTCTIAETVNITFSVELDPAIVSATPSLTKFNSPIQGTVTTAAKLVMGNDPR